MSDAGQKQLNLDEAHAVYRESPNEDTVRQLMEAGRGLIYHFARLYSRDHPGDDMIQAGYEGLIKALKRYDPDKGASFTTYASHLIRGEIRHFLRDEASFYRPGCLVDLQSKVERFIDEETVKNGQPPDVETIAEALNVREEGVVEVMRAGLVPLDSVDLSKVRSIRYETFRLPVEDQVTLQQAIRGLSEIQRKVVDLLFYRDMTQEQAAQELGTNQRQVSRLLHRSLANLYEAFGGGDSHR